MRSTSTKERSRWRAASASVSSMRAVASAVTPSASIAVLGGVLASIYSVVPALVPDIRASRPLASVLSLGRRRSAPTRGLCTGLAVRAPSRRSGRERRRHFLEGPHVGVDRIVAVYDRERPLLLAAGGHVDAAVHVPQPGELGDGDVLVGLEALVVDNGRGGERDAALRADADGVAGQAVALDHRFAA